MLHLASLWPQVMMMSCFQLGECDKDKQYQQIEWRVEFVVPTLNCNSSSSKKART